MAEKQNEREVVMVLAPVIERYVFAKPLQGDDAKEIVKEVKGRVRKDFRNASAFNGYFEFNEQTGQINGSNPFYCILIDQLLSKQDLWLPTVVEAKKLEAAGKLSNGVYRENGIAVYDTQNPNSKIAEQIIAYANSRGWQLPILAPFKALGIKKGGEHDAVITLRNALRIIAGEEARQYLKEQINYPGFHGACRLDRGRGGGWYANGGDLPDSNVDGRVDFACGEATAKNLEAAVISDVNRTCQLEVDNLNKRISNARDAATKVMRS